jgi:hypothetical protein
MTMISDSDATADFERLAALVSEIIEARGYKRLPLAGWYWETGRSRVQLSKPSESASAFSYIVSRQRYDFSAEGERVLLPQAHPLPVERGADAERIAAIVEDQLTNPY